MTLLIAAALTITVFLWFFIVLYMFAGLSYHIVLGVLRVCSVDVSGIEGSVRHILNKFMGD